ncbi:RteC domain-containing protein [Sphingobacterium bambusae]|uniref:RteC domain-containing protein n=1 Tax=Sphingobacterium bambusae TaxID=662858 RepID=A0ABW6BKI1_9SPHI|nr:RteC domain-containing protein [Sphingobacterium bambusae]WPL49419.1 RteC domain-containing protein [Sphingobacterium bambusae]
MLSIEYETLYSSMLEQLQNINGALDEAANNLSDSLYCTVSSLQSLREMLKKYPPEDEAEQIYFFKYVKPKFQSWHIYVIEIHHLLLSVPIGTEQMIRDYYMNELHVINRFTQRYAFYYQYYLTNETSKDADFFLPSNKTEFPPEQENIVVEAGFATNMDFIFAKFRAFDMLRDFIIKRVRLLYQKVELGILSELVTARKFWWSGDKVELIELAYGIYHTHRFNGGAAEINDIVQWLEESLHVDLGQAYRMFLDIRRRKTVSYTKYLDEMSAAIHHHIDESNSLKRKKKKVLRST